jgi:hypothetical protein
VGGYNSTASLLLSHTLTSDCRVNRFISSFDTRRGNQPYTCNERLARRAHVGFSFIMSSKMADLEFDVEALISAVREFLCLSSKAYRDQRVRENPRNRVSDFFGVQVDRALVCFCTTVIEKKLVVNYLHGCHVQPDQSKPCIYDTHIRRYAYHWGVRNLCACSCVITRNSILVSFKCSSMNSGILLVLVLFSDNHSMVLGVKCARERNTAETARTIVELPGVSYRPSTEHC